MKIIKENIVALPYLANLIKLILLVSILKHSESRPAARPHRLSGRVVVVNLSCRNFSALLPAMGCIWPSLGLSGPCVGRPVAF